MNPSEGHRQRLRQKFKENPQSLADAEQLELLLTYAIPRKDVAPLAQELIAHFGSLRAALAASPTELAEIAGLGESTMTFFQLLQAVLANASETSSGSPASKPGSSPQLNLFDLKPEIPQSVSPAQPVKQKQVAKDRPMRVFANDEIANSLTFLPQATGFKSLEEYRRYLQEKLPYNAAETRRRRANNILERFFPGGGLDVPLTDYLGRYTTQADLKPVIFYHVLKAEPIAAKVAEELIWPALPVGRLEREQMREFVLRYLPEASASSQVNLLRSLFYTYDLLGVGAASDTTLRFQLRVGTLESFLYILTSEFPEPGIHSFETLYSGPIQRWLLWDREWIRLQLYNLQDFGVVTKVSEIDTVRQFSLALDQSAALRLFFEHPQRGQKAIREPISSQAIDPEDPS